MNPLLYQGDLAIIKTTNPADVQVGDVISLSVTPANQQKYGLPSTIVHRVASIQDAPAVGRVFTTKGDNNPERDSFITLADNVNGVMVAHVPKAGYPLLYIQGPSAPLLGAVVAGLILTYLILGWAESRGKEAKAREEIITRLAIGLPTLQNQIEQLSYKLAADGSSDVGTVVQYETVAVTQTQPEPSPYAPPVALLAPSALEHIAEPDVEEILADPVAEEIVTDEIVVEHLTEPIPMVSELPPPVMVEPTIEPIAPVLSELPPPAPVAPPVAPALSQLPPPSLFTQTPTKTPSDCDPLTAPIEDVLAYQAAKEAQRR
jgi:signal peptidase I